MGLLKAQQSGAHAGQIWQSILLWAKATWQISSSEKFHPHEWGFLTPRQCVIFIFISSLPVNDHSLVKKWKCVCVCVCVCTLSLQSCLTLCDPMDCSSPGSSVHGILQVRILEWVAMTSSRGSSWPGIKPRTPSNSCVRKICGSVLSCYLCACRF